MKNRRRKIMLAAFVVTLCFQLAPAQEKAAAEPPIVALTLEPVSANGVFGKGAPIQMKVRIKAVSSKAREGRLIWDLQTENQKPITSVTARCQVPARGEVILEREFKPPTAGFFYVSCRFESDGEADVVSRMVVGSEPEKITAPLTARPDFDEFWSKTLDELSHVKPQFQATRLTEQSTQTRDLFLVEMRSLGNVRVRGWLEVPRKSGKQPTLLRVPGYGGDLRPLERDAGMIVFSFNVRAHGNSQDDVNGQPRDYWLRGLDRKESYYYRGAYADCIRAIDYLCSRRDVSQTQIAVWGGSQGGGLSWMTAALDPRVDLCVADIPWLADWVNYFELTDWPEVNEWIAARPERTWKTTLETLSYFDTLNVASRIKCPVLMRVGLQDRICPPSTSFATFNRLSGPKEFIVYPRARHRIGRGHYQYAEKWIRRKLKPD